MDSRPERSPKKIPQDIPCKLKSKAGEGKGEGSGVHSSRAPSKVNGAEKFHTFSNFFEFASRSSILQAAVWTGWKSPAFFAIIELRSEYFGGSRATAG